MMGIIENITLQLCFWYIKHITKHNCIELKTVNSYDDYFRFKEITDHYVQLGIESDKDKKENNKTGYVYLLQSEHGYKIGHSKNVYNRLKEFSVKLPFEVNLIHQFYADNRRIAESELHKYFNEKNIDGEWFDLSDRDILKIKTINCFYDKEFLSIAKMNDE